MKFDYALIDPPITPYSTHAEIKEWIKVLEDMNESPQRLEELKRARKQLKKTPK